jgi:glycine/D-amino acid oxidase-like deaminating enzyme/nitrite reductase/ring-hydroxylating ferredoxin subunit
MKQIRPGGPRSLWIETTRKTHYEKLAGEISVDVAVIGGGLVGLTAAALLQDAGLKVAVIDARRIAAGVTGYTTAKVTSLHGSIYQRLKHSFGQDGARTYAEANQAAIEQVAGLIRDRSIDCDFTRTRAYTYTEDEDQVQSLRDEAEIAADAGLPAAFTEQTPLPFDIKGAVVVENQAQFHPRKYLLALADDLTSRGGLIFENTTVSDITHDQELKLKTTGGTVRANHAIVASHFPFYDKGFFYGRMVPKRAYLLALRLKETPPSGMFYSRRDEESYSLRDYQSGEESYLLVGAGTHVTGHVADTLEFYRRALDYATERFPVASLEYYWSTEDYRTFDGVPFIGLSPHSDSIYVATGMGGWGMSNGTLAAMLIRDSIVEQGNSWAEFFSPKRMGAGAVKQAVARGPEMMTGLAKGKFGRPQPGAPEDLEPGEGQVMEYDGRKAAVCKTIDGRIHALTSSCTHMGCQVTWNTAEQSWDCPCHGSVFRADGAVVYGPALYPLKPLRSD